MKRLLIERCYFAHRGRYRRERERVLLPTFGDFFIPRYVGISI